MAAKGETSSSKVRNREFLLEIEAKVRKWWEDEKVFSAECEKPGHKFFGKLPFDSFMENPFSLSKLEWLPDIPIDVIRFALVYVCDGAVDEAKINFLHSNAASVYNAANTAILKFNEEMSWHEEFLAADFESLRCGPPSTFADRVFANEINIALNRTKEQYEAGQFRGALDSIFELQDARDWYKISCGGTNAMNRDLVWRFMDVQTCLITPICPHYREYVWRDLLNKMDFVVNADWPVADAPDESILQSGDKYLKDLIDSMKRHVESERNKKGTALATTSLTDESQKLEALIYVNEAGDTLTFSTEALHTDFKQHGNEFNQNAKVKFGDQFLDLKLPFREKVLLQNLNFIKREIGLDKVQVLSATNPGDLAKAGSPIKLSDAESSSPGKPAILSLTCPKRDFRSFGTSKTTPLMADLSSSGSAPKHTNPLTMLSLWPKFKLPQIFSQREENYPEELSQREKYYPEKCHNNPASLYRPPSKLLFQGSFDKALDTACNQDKWLLVNMQCLDNFSSHMLNHHVWSEKAVCETISTNLIFWHEYFDTPEGDMVSRKYILDSRTIVLLIDPMTSEAMCSWKGMVNPNDFMEDLVPYLLTSPKNNCVPQEEKELLRHTSKLETSSGSTSKAKQD
ncbi:PREDICTED: leucine--tRNA ligase, cytoplasmic-like [Fragaria vesca subsp. vesca]|uniref:leucine--tRNA ligase, cytoplasmic-like n=1 Tax=Fragaria vesca subsp. vesca TaxID=101020 RepID=UPI0002C2FF7B|nr:PREDICTED: leucine--tRNA ligase, cytoplasmic-like [Fragaria vesca subsp. vesca]